MLSEHPPFPLQRVYISSDGVRALTVGSAGIRIWDLCDLNSPRPQVLREDYYREVLSLDGRWVAMTDWDGKLLKQIFELWNVNDLDHPVMYPLPECEDIAPSCLSISPDCRMAPLGRWQL